MARLATYAEDRALARTDVVFAESLYTQNLLLQRTRPEAILLGPPGVDTEFFHPCRSPRPDGPILCVGRLRDSRKNVRMLLDAYAILVRQTPAPPLHLVGRGGITAADQQYAQQLDIADKIKVFRDVSLEQLRELYQSSSIFVLPSNEEGLGIVILEAMACGLPVVSTDCGGPATAIVPGETGFLVPVGNAQRFAQTMQMILAAADLRARMGAAGRKRVEDRFSLERTGSVYFNAYKRLLNERRTRERCS
jgi:glycosyltransferase involved in cell wall biosynthesis